MDNTIGINHVTILVKNKEISRNFYTNILGFNSRIVANKHLWIILGNQYIHVSTGEVSTKPNSFYHFAINIQDFKQYIQGLLENKVVLFKFDNDNRRVPISIGEDLSNCFLEDPDGNLLELVDIKNEFFNPQTQ